MRKINESLITTHGALYIKQGTLAHLQKAYIEPIAEMVKSMIGSSYDSSKVYVLNGCVNSGAGSNYIISAGSVFYNGEVYLVDAATFTVTTGVPVATIVTTANTADYSADPALFEDTTSQNVHDINKVVIAEATSGSGIKDYSGFEFLPFASAYDDRSSAITVNASKFDTTLSKTCRVYKDGTVYVEFSLGHSGTAASGDTILSGLPYTGQYQILQVIDDPTGTPAIKNAYVTPAGYLKLADSISTTIKVIYCQFTYKKY